MNCFDCMLEELQIQGLFTIWQEMSCLRQEMSYISPAEVLKWGQSNNRSATEQEEHLHLRAQIKPARLKEKTMDRNYYYQKRADEHQRLRF